MTQVINDEATFTAYMFKNKKEFEKSKEKVKYTMEIDTGACKLEIVFAMKPKADGTVSMKLRTQIKMGW